MKARFGILALASLLLAACGDRYGIRENVSAAPPVGKALVVVGFSYTGDVPKADASGRTDCPAFNALGRGRLFVEFERQPEPGRESRGYEFTVRDISCARVTPAAPVHYNFFHPLPGTYRMTSVFAVESGSRKETLIRNLPNFHVAEGETVYVGDILVRSLFPANLTLGRSDAAANAAFAAHGGSGRNLIFRPLSLPPQAD